MITPDEMPCANCGHSAQAHGRLSCLVMVADGSVCPCSQFVRPTSDREQEETSAPTTAR